MVMAQRATGYDDDGNDDGDNNGSRRQRQRGQAETTSVIK
jgi:hypothetical protein